MIEIVVGQLDYQQFHLGLSTDHFSNVVFLNYTVQGISTWMYKQEYQQLKKITQAEKGMTKLVSIENELNAFKTRKDDKIGL